MADPLRDDIEMLEKLYNDLARRVGYLDGNGLDKSGGQVGRLTAIVERQEKMMRKWEILFWIAFGGASSIGAGNLLFLREILRAIPK